jgi:uncharacterized membrane protein YdbT with pleckstrin-like domain
MVSLVQRIITKEASEHSNVIKIVRPHWFFILQQFIVSIIFVVLLLGSFFLVPTFVISSESDPQAYRLFLFVADSFTILIWIYSFIIWIENYFDIMIITNKKIININQKGLFIRRISELKFERIQDVTVEVSGILSTFMNYGHLQIQTAGENEWFTVYNVPDPYGLKNLIMELQKEQHLRETNALGEMVRKEINHEVK